MRWGAVRLALRLVSQPPALGAVCWDVRIRHVAHYSCRAIFFIDAADGHVILRHVDEWRRSVFGEAILHFADWHQVHEFGLAELGDRVGDRFGSSVVAREIAADVELTSHVDFPADAVEQE